MGLFSKLLTSVAGPLVGGAFGLFGGERRNASAQASAREQMAFQERMYGSRYQIQMEDMRKAGLNPILSYSSGPPAAPAGAQYTPINTMEPMQRGIESAVSSGLAAYRLNSEVEKIQAETDRAKAEAKKAEAQAGLSGEQAKSEPIRRWLMDAQAEQAHSASQLNRINREVRQVEENTAWQKLEIAKKEAIIAGIEAGFYSTGPGEVARVLQSLGVRPQDAGSLAKLLFRLLTAGRR